MPLLKLEVTGLYIDRPSKLLSTVTQFTVTESRHIKLKVRYNITELDDQYKDRPKILLSSCWSGATERTLLDFEF